MRKILNTGETVGAIGKLTGGARYAVVLDRAGGSWRIEVQPEDPGDGAAVWVGATEAENESKTIYFDAIPDVEYRITRSGGNGNAQAWISEAYLASE